MHEATKRRREPLTTNRKRAPPQIRREFHHSLPLGEIVQTLSHSHGRFVRERRKKKLQKTGQQKAKTRTLIVVVDGQKAIKEGDRVIPLEQYLRRKT